MVKLGEAEIPQIPTWQAPGSLTANELVLTLVDQAHQNRRLHDQNVQLTGIIDEQNRTIFGLQQQLEAKQVADEIQAAAPQAAEPPARADKKGG